MLLIAKYATIRHYAPLRATLCHYVIRSDECERIANDLGDKSVMILRNHGLLTTGSTVADAFMKLYTLESACQVQLMAINCT